MPAFSARNSRIRFEGVGILGLKWTVNTKVDEIDVSNFEGGGYADYIGGLWEADISFDAIVDSAAIIGNFITIYAGKTTGVVDFYMDIGTAVSPYAAVVTTQPATTRRLTFPSLLITSVSIDAEVRSFVRMSVSAKNKGSYSLPSGG